MKRAFDYSYYSKLMEAENYISAMDYAQEFKGSKPAEVCLINAKICAGVYDEDNPDYKQNLFDAYQKYLDSGIFYDSNAAFLLGTMLYSSGCNTEAVTVLEKIKKKNDKAKAFLEKRYFEQWQHTGDVDFLKKAADCRYNSMMCYLYADTIMDEAPQRAELYRDSYSMDCKMYQRYECFFNEKSQRTIMSAINELQDDIDIGFNRVLAKTDDIMAQIDLISKKLDGIEENVMGELKAGFREVDKITESVRRLSSEQQAETSMILDCLEEWRMTKEMIYQDSVVSYEQMEAVLKKLDDLALSVDNIENNLEAHCKSIADKLTKLTFKDHENDELNGLVNAAYEAVNNQFGNELDEISKKSLVSAVFTLAFYKKLSGESLEMTDFSGVTILAAAPLEFEINKRIVIPYLEFLENRFHDNGYSYFKDRSKLKLLPYKTAYEKKAFNSKVYAIRGGLELASFKLITGSESDESQYCADQALSRQGCIDLFIEFLKNNRYKSRLNTTYAQYIFAKTPRLSRLESFSERVESIREIRNKAAHSDFVSQAEAEKVCEYTFGKSGLKFAEETSREVKSLLELLINSVKRDVAGK